MKCQNVITADEGRKNIMAKQKKIDKNSTQTCYMVPKSTLIVMGTIGTALLTIMGWLALQVYNFNGDMKGIPGKVDAIETAINGDGTQDNPGLNARLIALENSNKTAINASIETTVSMSGVSIEPNEVSRTTASLDGNAILGTDVNGKECITSDYVDQQILLTYTENGKEVYFLGQFNEKYHWNGYCIVNAYDRNGALYGICESNFQDGVRLDFLSLVHDESADDWIYSNRICETSCNVGENKTYKYDAVDEKYFTQTNVRVSDIVMVNPYMESHEMTLMTKYIEQTVDGKYNDQTGEAYYISYYDDQTVKTLYQGCFENGQMCDASGKAWQIACNRDNNTKYLYYRGVFKNGLKRDVDGLGITQTDLTDEKIRQILKENNCTLELKWDEQLVAERVSKSNETK